MSLSSICKSLYSWLVFFISHLTLAYGYYTIYEIVATLDFGPFSLVHALACYVRVLAPIGQIPPASDFFLSSLTAKYGSIFALTCFIVYALTDNYIYAASFILFFFKVARIHITSVLLQKRLNEIRRQYKSREMKPTDPHYLIKMHPYLFNLFDGDTVSGDVRLTTHAVNVDITIDVWRRENTVTNKAIVVYIHGGAWLFGNSKENNQVHLLQHLATNDVIVFALNYRKWKWPTQLQDCLQCFEYALQHAAEFGGDPTKVTIAGASSGGHLALLLYLNWRLKNAPYSTISMERNNGLSSDEHRENRSNHEPNSVFSSINPSLMLYYPAVDPIDDTMHTAFLPFIGPCLYDNSPPNKTTTNSCRFHRSLLSSYFEAAVLHFHGEFWDEVCPMRIIAKNPWLCDHWPKTLIVHGELDSIIPIEHSRDFIRFLVAMGKLRRQDIHLSQNSNESYYQRVLSYIANDEETQDYDDVYNEVDSISFLRVPEVKHAFENAGNGLFMSHSLLDHIFDFSVHWIYESHRSRPDAEL